MRYAQEGGGTNMLTMTDNEGNTSMEYHLVDVKLDEGKIAVGYVASMENLTAQ